MDRITSRQNPLVATFRQAAQHAASHVLLEGSSLVLSALDCGLRIDVAVVRDEGGQPLTAEHAAVVARLERASVRVVGAPERVISAISPSRSPSGLVAVGLPPRWPPEALFAPSPALVVVAIDVQDPGNLGAVIRAADAAGATGVITTPGSASPYGWKALRGSMGSGLRLPIWTTPWPDALAALRRHEMRIVAAAPRANASFNQIDWRRPTALLLGNEGSGLPSDVLTAADALVSVPMRAGVESLNVAVTAALLVYEARRQRAGTDHG